MPHLTEDEILRADHEHSERGMEPTQTALRAHLGYRGSYARISRALRAWQAAQQEREALEETSVAEEEQLALGIGARVWKAAGEIADIGKAELRREIARQQAEKEAKAQEHERVVKELEAELMTAREETERNEDTQTSIARIAVRSKAISGSSSGTSAGTRASCAIARTRTRTRQRSPICARGSWPRTPGPRA